MKEIPAMYRKLQNIAQELAKQDRESNEEIARRLRFTKKEVRDALAEIKRRFL